MCLTFHGWRWLLGGEVVLYFFNLVLALLIHGPAICGLPEWVHLGRWGTHLRGATCANSARPVRKLRFQEASFFTTPPYPLRSIRQGSHATSWRQKKERTPKPGPLVTLCFVLFGFIRTDLPSSFKTIRNSIVWKYYMTMPHTQRPEFPQ